MARSGHDRFGQLLFYGIVLLVGYLAYRVVQPFLASLTWAAIFAMTMNPLQRRFTRQMGRGRAAAATTTVTALLIVLPIIMLGSMLTAEVPRVVDFVQTLPEQTTPERVSAVWDAIRERVPFDLPADPTALVQQGAQNVLGWLAPRLGGLAANVFATLGSLFVMLFALFFLLRDGDRIGQLVRRLLPFPADERERLMNETRDLVIAGVGAALTVAFVQGVIGAIAFWALGVQVPAIWGAAMGVCSLIPVVGTALIWVPATIWWLLSGDIVRGVIMIAIGTGVIGLVDNVLRPIILSGRTSANGLIVFIGLLGGVSAFGFVGLVLGPIVLVMAGSLIDALTRERKPPAQAAAE
jgi:predicted PurR-regulated permease PerM